MKSIIEVFTCDNCGKRIEARYESHTKRTQLYNENFIHLSVETMPFDICKDCCRTMKFIPEVIL